MRGNCFGFRYARRLDVLFLVLFFVKSCLSVRFTFTSFSQNVTYWFWLTFTQRGFPRVSLNAKQTDSLVLTNPPRQMGQFIWLHRCSISVGMGKWNWVQKPLSPPTHPPTDPPSPQRTQCSVCVCVSADKRPGREAILACFFCLRVFFHCSSSSSTFSSSLSIPSTPPTPPPHRPTLLPFSLLPRLPSGSLFWRARATVWNRITTVAQDVRELRISPLVAHSRAPDQLQRRCRMRFCAFGGHRINAKIGGEKKLCLVCVWFWANSEAGK